MTAEKETTMNDPTTCDRRGCHEPAAGGAACMSCGKSYARCATHGSARGASRSVHSHAALYHPNHGAVR